MLSRNATRAHVFDRLDSKRLYLFFCISRGTIFPLSTGTHTREHSNEKPKFRHFVEPRPNFTGKRSGRVLHGPSSLFSPLSPTPRRAFIRSFPPSNRYAMEPVRTNNSQARKRVETRSFHWFLFISSAITCHADPEFAQ